MGKKQDSQAGSGAIVTIAVAVFVVVLGAGGWLLYQMTQPSGTETGEPVTRTVPASTTKTNSGASATKKLYLDNSNVSYSLPSDWVAIAATDASSVPCGQSATGKVAASDCVDRAVFVLASEGYSANPDQFYAEAAVFSNAGARSSKDWFNQLGISDSGGAGSDATINGVTAYKYIVHPNPSNKNRVDIYYAVAKGARAVLVHSELFDGDHYSYKTTNNYLTYEDAIGDIAETVAFAQ
jgi:hypothetical protein